MADTGGDAAENAILATLAQLDGLSGLADFLLVFEQARAENGHEAFNAVHGTLEGGEAVTVEFEEAGGSVGGIGDPGSAGANFETGRTLEAADPGGGKSGVMEAMFVIGVEAIMIEIDGDEVLQR